MCLQLCATHLKVTGCSGKPQQTGSLKHTKIVLDPALFHAKPIYVTLKRTSPQTHSKDGKNRRACVLVIQRQIKRYSSGHSCLPKPGTPCLLWHCHHEAQEIQTSHLLNPNTFVVCARVHSRACRCAWVCMYWSCMWRGQRSFLRHHPVCLVRRDLLLAWNSTSG